MNRRFERRPEDVEKLLKANGYKIRNILNVGELDEKQRFLEGTGSMIIDHRAEVVYEPHIIPAMGKRGVQR